MIFFLHQRASKKIKNSSWFKKSRKVLDCIEIKKGFLDFKKLHASKKVINQGIPRNQERVSWFQDGFQEIKKGFLDFKIDAKKSRKCFLISRWCQEIKKVFLDFKKMPRNQEKVSWFQDWSKKSRKCFLISRKIQEIKKGISWFQESNIHGWR